MMISNKALLLIYIILFLTLGSVITSFAEEGTGTDAGIDKNAKPGIILVPLGGEDVASYIPMIVDRLFEAKIDKTEAYAIFTRVELAAILKENDITLPDNITDETARKIGERLGMDQVLYGSISLDGSDFVINSKIMDVETGFVISDNTERTQDIKGLEVAVGKLTRSIVQTVLPAEAVAEAVQTLDAAEQTDKEADVQESITAFEKLAEEDPEQALEMVGEPAREALKETVREEIVDEEVQNLFDQEKAEKKRKWQFWTVVGLESFVQLGNIFGAAAVDYRLESSLHWSNYMNNIFIDDPYRSYRDTLDSSQGNQVANYLFTGGANFGLAYAYKTFPDDLFSLSSNGRRIFTISNMMQISGYMARTATSQLGFYAQRKYLEYSTATSDFTVKYEAYRSAYLLPMITEYTRTGLWTLGIAGMVTAALLPGEKTPLILSDKSRKYLFWGQTLVSIGNLTSGMATNFRGKAEEYWISDNSPSGTIGESSYLADYITSQILYYSTYAIYIGGAFFTYLGLTSDGAAPGDDSVADNSLMGNFSFAIVPAGNGLTAVARLRLD